MKIADQIKHERELETARDEAKLYKAKYNYVSRELKNVVKQSKILSAIDMPIAACHIKPIKHGKGDAAAIVVLSDFHVEEYVDPTTINNLNSYNLDIATQRIECMFQNALRMIDVSRHLTSIDTLVIAVLGDMISSYIHPELEENNQLSPTEAILFVQDLLVNGIRFLKREGGFKHVIVPTCFGNHGRTTLKKRCATGFKNSYEWLLYQHLSRTVTDPGLTWQVENGYFNWLNVKGYDVRFSHGDNLHYMGGVGGISICVNKAIAQWNKVRTAHYDYFGHYHQFLNFTRWTCNGSTIGYSPYALSIKAEYEVPSQTFSVISKTRGKVLTDRIFCD